MRRTIVLVLGVVAQAGAQGAAPGVDAMAAVPRLDALVARATSELAPVVERYSSDLSALSRRYDAPGSPAQRARLRAHHEAWRARLRELDVERLSAEGRADWVLLDSHLRYQLALMDRAERQRAEMAPWLPFADRLLALQDERRALRDVDPPAAARTLAQVTRTVDSLRASLESPPRPDSLRGGLLPARPSRTVANRAAETIDVLRGTVRGWHRFHDGFDPAFSWWLRAPYAKLDSSLVRYARVLRERVVGLPAPLAQQLSAAGAGPGSSNEGPIVGDPVGLEGLQADLQHAMIPYTPQELVAIAEKEYAFSLAEMKKASRELGFGDDWKRAMETVKDRWVAPGKQPPLIRDLAREAEGWFAARDLVTIPPLATEDWRMEMLSPERQRVSPFFLGGDLILVSYPTDAMSDDEKAMSLRGNNPHFSRAVVHHELNPGHHLQQFMQERHNRHRRLFATPFWNEGQALYWEMVLWDAGFHADPRDRIGALFWRMHRSARIIFSLNFHLGRMTPEQAVQFLVDTVNFERANAEGEVRRSFNGSYPPIYQAAYMLGGLQLRALHAEVVRTGKMTDRRFHDAVLEGGAMPIAMIRARLLGLPIPREGLPAWKFADRIPASVPYPSR